MKTYTFTIPKKETVENQYKSFLIDNILKKNPWFMEKKETKPTFKLENFISSIDLSNYTYDYNNYNCNIVEDDFINLIAGMKNYIDLNPFDKGYDFKNMFGEPVKIFDDFIQIGYEIIPIKSGMFSFLKPKTKKIVIDILIKVKSTKTFY